MLNFGGVGISDHPFRVNQWFRDVAPETIGLKIDAILMTGTEKSWMGGDKHMP